MLILRIIRIASIPDTSGEASIPAAQNHAPTLSTPSMQQPFQSPQHTASRRERSSTPLVALHHLGDCVTDGDARLLRLLLGQTRRHADLDGRSWLPSFVSWVSPQAERIGLEPCDEDAVGKTLLHVSVAFREYSIIKAYLVDCVLQQLSLVFDAPAPGSYDIRLQGQDRDWVVYVACALDPIAPGIQLCSHGFDVISQRRQNLGLFLEHGYRFTGGCREQGRKGSRVGVGCGGDALVLHHFFGCSAETSCCTQRPRKVADYHVNLPGVHVLCFRESATSPAEDAVGPRLVQNQTELVLVLEFNLT
jgi:hypothetical protein